MSLGQLLTGQKMAAAPPTAKVIEAQTTTTNSSRTMIPLTTSSATPELTNIEGVGLENARDYRNVGSSTIPLRLDGSKAAAVSPWKEYPDRRSTTNEIAAWLDCPEDDRFTRGLIRRKINQLIGRAGFTNQDREDLEQEVLARVLQSMPSFNPEEGHPNPFITAVVERYVANILRNKQAPKRDHRRISSLNVMVSVSEEGPTELVQTISDRELDSRLGRNRRPDDELIQLSIDVDTVVASLPKSWQTLVKLLMTQTMSQAAREMGMPRTTLNDWMRHIRRRFEKAGLRDYL